MCSPHARHRSRGKHAVSILAMLTVSASHHVQAQGPPDTLWMRGSHLDEVTAVGFSRDGRLIVSASLDHTVKVWRSQIVR